MSQEYPDHLAKNAREWKQRKRREIRELDNCAELDDLLCGCAFTPAYEEIAKAREIIRLAREKMSVKNWGR